MKRLILSILLFLGICINTLSQVQPIPMPKGYERLDQFPIDTSSVFTNKTEAEIYAADEGNTGYKGQIIAVTDEESPGVYYINNDRELAEIGGALTIIGKQDAGSSVVSNAGTTKIRFNHESGMYVSNISPDEVQISLGSAWYTLYLDDGFAEGYTPKGEQPINVIMNHDPLVTTITMDTNTTPYWTLKIPSVGTPGIDGTGDLLFGREWNITKPYSSNTIVTWNDSTYISKNIEDNIGIEPGVDPLWEDYWYVGALKGGKGDTGLDGATFIPMGIWVEGTPYDSNQLVRCGSAQYYSLIDDNTEVPTNSVNWELFVQDGDQGIQGVQGTSAVVAVVGTYTGEPGTDAIVTDESGVPHIANLRFTIPRGEPGLGLVPFGLWDEEYSYPSNSLVRQSTNLYYNIVDSTGDDPLTHSEIWTLILSDGYQGIQGDIGPTGIGAVVNVIGTHTIPYTDDAAVINTGEEPHIADLEFYIPQGVPGLNLAIWGDWTNNVTYLTNSVVRRSTNLYYNTLESYDQDPLTNSITWHIFLSDGWKGDQGPIGLTGTGAVIYIRTPTITLPPDQDAYVTDESPEPHIGHFQFGIPRGYQGTSAVVEVESTVTLPPDQEASVEDMDPTTPYRAYLRFSIPQGETGDIGPAGQIDTVSATTIPYNVSASVENTGTVTNAKLNFKIPRGRPGAGLIPYGNWSSNVNYPTNALVRYDTAQYYNNSGGFSSNCIPTNCTDWAVFVKDGGSVAGDATLISIYTNETDYIDLTGRWQLDTNTLGINESGHITVVGGTGSGASMWDVDVWGGLMPATNIAVSIGWEYDINEDIMPTE